MKLKKYILVHNINRSKTRKRKNEWREMAKKERQKYREIRNRRKKMKKSKDEGKTSN